ncbi:MAG: signal peptide protein [Candidatus Acidoferrum typicum]|nr:signal peptide protein [Candidatus Acidoferrum typicum]
MQAAGIRLKSVFLLVGLGMGIVLSLFSEAETVVAQEPPKFKVDPSWPKELPNNWIMGQVGGMAMDRHDHIWVLQRPGLDTVDELGAAQTPPLSQCCFAAPPVLEFDTNGNLLQSWGGPGEGFDWPKREHGIYVDKDDNVWISGAGTGDRQILKFKDDGHFLMQIGHPSADPANSSRTDILGLPAGMELDSQAHEIYIADGYMNKRVIVYDSDKGTFKRLWGAYGNPPNDADPGPYNPAAPPDRQFRNPVHCVHISRDGLVYVCDRVNDRLQAFTKQGKFVKEFFVRPQTLAIGSVWQFTFSADENQKYLLVADGENNVIWTLRREDGAVVGQTGHNGRNAGQFHWVHQIVSDTQGNLYTGEVDTGQRIQKFILQH